jgi:hypothetical protein
MAHQETIFERDALYPSHGQSRYVGSSRLDKLSLI